MNRYTTWKNELRCSTACICHYNIAFSTTFTGTDSKSSEAPNTTTFIKKMRFVTQNLQHFLYLISLLKLSKC